MDYLLNGQAHGELFRGAGSGVAQRLLNNNMDPNVLRPWIGNDGRSYRTIIGNDGKPKVALDHNATATLRKDDWIVLDSVISRAARQRLGFVSDLQSRGLTFQTPGMGASVLQTEKVGEISPARISMDGTTESDGDRPEFQLDSLPLPIVHKDFQFPLRQVAISRRGDSPLDTTTAELAGRQVAEEVEKLALGKSRSFQYAGGNVYGLTNFPDRNTSTTLTDPTSSAWTGKKTLQDVLGLMQQSRDDFHFGPWMLYIDGKWDEYFDDDYKTESDLTLRQRIENVNGIEGVRTVDFLGDYEMILVQMESATIREIVGMDITTLQWESHGGMVLNFKVMAIMVPQVRADINSRCGIVHASTS